MWVLLQTQHLVQVVLVISLVALILIIIKPTICSSLLQPWRTSCKIVLKDDFLVAPVSFGKWISGIGISTIKGIHGKITMRHPAACHGLRAAVACGKKPPATSLIRKPLPQYDARVKPKMAMMTTEHAAGTAWLVPRNCVARSPARVELCIPVQTEIVLQTGSSCLQTVQNN